MQSKNEKRGGKKVWSSASTIVKILAFRVATESQGHLCQQTMEGQFPMVIKDEVLITL